MYKGKSAIRAPQQSPSPQNDALPQSACVVVRYSSQRCTPWLLRAVVHVYNSNKDSLYSLVGTVLHT